MTKKREGGQRLSIGAVSMQGATKVALANGKTRLVVRGLILFEGRHKGMYGPVEINPDFLNVMAERFNREHGKPQNEYDYPPLLKNHDRDVDVILGRVLGPFTVEDYENPRTGKLVKGLFSPLGIDDVDAQKNYEDGKYVHLSSSFDDEQDNFADYYECSFVAVEAARGAIAFEQGEGRMDLAAKLAAEEQKSQSLSAKITKLVDGRKAVALAIGKQIEAAKGDVATLSAGLVAAQKQFQVAATKSQFAAFIRQGKMTKAEFEKLNFEELAAMPTAALSALKSSYEGREPTTDMGQFGREGTETPPVKLQSKEAVRAAIKAQREGKKGAGQSLAADEPGGSGNDDDANKNKQAPAAEPMSAEDVTKVTKALADATDCIKKMSERLAALEGEKDKLEDDKESA